MFVSAGFCLCGMRSCSSASGYTKHAPSTDPCPVTLRIEFASAAALGTTAPLTATAARAAKARTNLEAMMCVLVVTGGIEE